MSAASWFRLKCEAVDDPSVRLLAPADRWLYIALLCCESKGLLDETDRLWHRKVAIKLEISTDELSALLGRLHEVGLVDGVRPSMRLVASVAADVRPCAEVWAKIRARIFARDNYTCQYCGAHGVTLECDHIVPVARGGSHDDDNLNTACFQCNRSKRDKTLAEWRGRA
jgi:5-methylcytosine-specific restriction endonuclease McrA